MKVEDYPAVFYELVFDLFVENFNCPPEDKNEFIVTYTTPAGSGFGHVAYQIHSSSNTSGVFVGPDNEIPYISYNVERDPDNGTFTWNTPSDSHFDHVNSIIAELAKRVLKIKAFL